MSTEPSGVDLARQALVAAREAAKKNGGAQTKKPKRRTGTVVRRDGCEPLGLGAVIGMMMTERGMVAPAAGGGVLAQFDDILAAAAPELAGHVQAVGFDADTGRLDVTPDAPAYGTQLRWSAPKLIAAANEKVQGSHVRTLHVLAPAAGKAGPVTAAADLDRQPAAPAGPVRTRETASDGYRRALAAHQAVAPPSRIDPSIAEVVEWQTAAMRALSLRAFPEPEAMADDQPAPIEQAHTERQRQADVSRAAACAGPVRSARRGRPGRRWDNSRPQRSWWSWNARREQNGLRSPCRLIEAQEPPSTARINGHEKVKETDEDAEEAQEGPQGAPEARHSSDRSSPAPRSGTRGLG
ncbi:DciA family protein [Streptomyces sp. NPDC093586]|uniref:DciA family protein n=1 Tax=Streptomyces sp. NPDC093586 TaxID=3366042 RepID=UPI00381F8418